MTRSLDIWHRALRPDRWAPESVTTAAVVGGALVFAHFIKAFSHLHYQSVDFIIFHEAVRRWFEGGTLYDAPGAAINYNPPHFHILVAPLMALPPAAAFIAWTAVSVAAACLTVRIALTEAVPSRSAGHVRLLIAAVLLSAGTGATIHLGQVSWIVALFLACGWRAARHDKWFRAGAWLGVAAALKPFLLLFLPVLLVRRRWRCAAAAIGFLALSIAAGAAVFGVEAVLQWVNLLRTPPPAVQMTYFINASLSAIFARASVPMGFSVSLVAVFAVVSVGITRTADEDRAWLITATSAILISPLGWIYYLPLLTAPLFAVATERRLPPAAWAAWPLLAVPPIGKEWLQGNALVAVTLGSVYAWGLLLLWYGEALGSSAERP